MPQSNTLQFPKREKGTEQENIHSSTFKDWCIRISQMVWLTLSFKSIEGESHLESKMAKWRLAHLRILCMIIPLTYSPCFLRAFWLRKCIWVLLYVSSALNECTSSPCTVPLVPWRLWLPHGGVLWKLSQDNGTEQRGHCLPVLWFSPAEWHNTALAVCVWLH